MKNKLFSILVLLILAAGAFAQSVPIDAEKVKGGYRFTQNGDPLSLNAMKNIMQENQEAVKLIRTAKFNTGFASVLAYSGGFCIGWPLGTALGGGDPQWGLLAVGVGLVAVAIPLSSSAGKKANEAVQIYNSSLVGSYYVPPAHLRIAHGDHGVGLILTF